MTTVELDSVLEMLDELISQATSALAGLERRARHADSLEEKATFTGLVTRTRIQLDTFRDLRSRVPGYLRRHEITIIDDIVTLDHMILP